MSDKEDEYSGCGILIIFFTFCVCVERPKFTIIPLGIGLVIAAYYLLKTAHRIFSKTLRWKKNKREQHKKDYQELTDDLHSALALKDQFTVQKKLDDIRRKFKHLKETKKRVQEMQDWLFEKFKEENAGVIFDSYKTGEEIEKLKALYQLEEKFGRKKTNGLLQKIDQSLAGQKTRNEDEKIIRAVFNALLKDNKKDPHGFMELELLRKLYGEDRINSVVEEMSDWECWRYLKKEETCER